MERNRVVFFFVQKEGKINAIVLQLKNTLAAQNLKCLRMPCLWPRKPIILIFYSIFYIICNPLCVVIIKYIMGKN